MEEIKKKTYTPKILEYVTKYRNENRQKYNLDSKHLYDKSKENEEWRLKFNERCRKNSKIARDRKRENDLLDGIQPKSRGRPKKIIIQIENEI